MSIIPKLKESAKQNAQSDIDAMEDMAADGLRTLMFAYKKLDSNIDVK